MVLPSIVNPTESLGRYLTQKNHFSRRDNAVRTLAFMPPPDSRLSVFRIDGLKLEEVWEIGQRKVINKMPEPRTLYGMADIKVSKVLELELRVEPNQLPSRHANICGWSEDKSKQKSIAQQLAAEANLIIK